MVDDNTLLLVGSGLMIAAFFAMKDKDDPSKVEAMEEDDDSPSPTKDWVGKKKKGENTEEQNLNEFAQAPEGTVQTVLKKAEMLAQEAGAAEESGVWPLSHSMRERVSRMQDKINEALTEYDRQIELVCRSTYQDPSTFTSRDSYRNLITFRDVMHAAVTASDQLRQSMEQRANVVNYVKQDFHKYEMQQNDNRVVEFNQQTAYVDQRKYDKRKYLSQAQVNNLYSTQETYVDERNLTFNQIDPGPMRAGLSAPPDRTIPGNSAPRLNPGMERDMILGRTQVMSQPHDNVRPLRLDQPEPIADSPPAVEDGFQSIIPSATDKRMDKKPLEVQQKQDILTSGDKREGSVMEFNNPRATKRKGIAPEDLFDSAPRADVNAAASAPNQLAITNTAFNQLGKAPEVTPSTSNTGQNYLDYLDKVYRRYLKIRNKFKDEEARVGVAAWTVINCAPTGGKFGEVYIDEHGSKLTWKSGNSQNWIDLMQNGEGDAGGQNASFRKMLKRSKAGMEYRNKSDDVVNFMKNTYQGFHSLNTYQQMR